MSKTAEPYRDLLCSIRPLSPFLTALQADTVWGMVAWACHWLQGNGSLKLFITLQPDGSPPLLISDAFPKGYLPRPRVPITVQDSRRLLRERWDERTKEYLQAMEVVKNWLARDYLPQEEVHTLLRGGKSAHLELLGRELDSGLARVSEGGNINLRGEGFRRHNRIDRQRGAALQMHGLYTHREFYHVGQWLMYLRTALPIEWLRTLFEYVGNNGFGKRASAGMGRFEILEIRALEEQEAFPKVHDADGFMTLSSSYVPADEEPIDRAFYLSHVKRGKLGPGAATAQPGGFLKYPMVMFQAGSVFSTSTPTRTWFGRLLGNIHRERTEVVHYGFAFPVSGRFFS